jgi:hypothetical protein
MKLLLTGAILLFPLVASADTLVLRNGARFRGTFNTANPSLITFTEYNGNRQSVNISDVLELRFGNDNAPNETDPGFGRTQNPGYAAPPNTNPAYDRDPNLQPGVSGIVDSLERIQADLQTAMDNNNLSGNERQSLSDSRAVLRTAAQQSRSGRAINQRGVRLALDSIRNNANRMQPQDRDILNEDIRRINAAASLPLVNGGRDY